MKIKATGKNRIPEALGNRTGGAKVYVAAIFLNALLHAALLFFFKFSADMLTRLIVSFIFFIYPFCFTADALWSMRPSVCKILSGETRINRKYYMNTPRAEVDRKEYSTVTVSIPVYLEENSVIFDTVRSAVKAVKQYSAVSGKYAGVIVSDDGLAPLLGGRCEESRIEELIRVYASFPERLGEKELKAAERICFYRQEKVGFVARAAAGRAGLFKKSSNLNSTLRLGKALMSGENPEAFKESKGALNGIYYEGSVITEDIILLLDKDSGMKPGIIEAIVPEFAADMKLAYVQCATDSVNMHENYYAYAQGHLNNSLFHTIWPCKALQGFFVPLVGHNAFIRRSALEATGLWSENKVSEDYDKAIDMYNRGWHGKYAQLPGLEFTEYVSRTFTEETGKQYRYSYGLFEMIFGGTIVPGRSRPCDTLFMLVYFCSLINEVLLIPSVLLENYFGNVHILWAGFLVCSICFIVMPCVRGLIMRGRVPKDRRDNIAHTVIISVSFIGHAFSMMAGAVRYIADRFRKKRRSFPSTSVDSLKYRIIDGLKTIGKFIGSNIFYIPVTILCIDRAVLLLTKKGIDISSVITYSVILFGLILVPFIMTPQLFPVSGRIKEKKTGTAVLKGGKRMQTSLPKVTDSASEIDDFLASYSAALNDAASEVSFPSRIASEYTVESCIRHDDTGRKEVYLLSHISDGQRAILRVTKDCPEEDALEEAELLKRLNCKGVPKVYDSFVDEDKHYIIREYVEGNSLYDIVRNNGVLSTDEIFGVTLKLAEILRYLHAQTPPVIHRDIKPQNIIIGLDGSVNIIDFGIARTHKEERSHDTTVVLTHDYAPPEQYGFEQTSPLTDIYSLGVVMLFLATGKVIKSGLESQIVNNRLREIIKRCIAFDPKSRIQSVDEIIDFIKKKEGQSRKRTVRAVSALAAASAAALAAVFIVGYSGGKSGIIEKNYTRGKESGYTDGFEAAPVFRAGEGKLLNEKGNLQGNLTAPGGAFVLEAENNTYFIENGGIFRLAEDCDKGELIAEVPGACRLSYDNGWLYAASESSVTQTNIYTLETLTLWKNAEDIRITPEGYFIFTGDGTLLLNTESITCEKLNSVSWCHYMCTDGKTLWFIDNRGQLHSCNMDGTDEKLYPYENCTGLCLFEDAVYLVSEGNVVKLEKENCSVLLEGNIKQIIASPKGIIFIDGSDGTICLSTADGRIRQRISDSKAESINLAGDLVFYRNIDDNGNVWCVRYDGTNDHRIETGAEG